MRRPRGRSFDLTRPQIVAPAAFPGRRRQFPHVNARQRCVILTPARPAITTPKKLRERSPEVLLFAPPCDQCWVISQLAAARFIPCERLYAFEMGAQRRRVIDDRPVGQPPPFAFAISSLRLTPPHHRRAAPLFAQKQAARPAKRAHAMNAFDFACLLLVVAASFCAAGNT